MNKFNEQFSLLLEAYIPYDNGFAPDRKKFYEIIVDIINADTPSDLLSIYQRDKSFIDRNENASIICRMMRKQPGLKELFQTHPAPQVQQWIKEYA